MSKMDVNKYVYCTIKTEICNTVTQYIQHVQLQNLYIQYCPLSSIYMYIASIWVIINNP